MLNMQDQKKTRKKEPQEEVFAAFMNSPIGIYIIQDRAFVFANRKFQEITEYSETELLGKNPFGLIVPEDRALVRENARLMLKGQKNDPYHYRVLSKSGRTLWIMETVASIQHGDRRAVLGNFMDITETNGYRTTFMNTPIGIYVIQDREFVYANPKFQEITGYSESELVGMNSFGLVLPEDRPYVREQGSRMLKGARSEPYYYRVKTRNGDERWIMETVASIRHKGKLAVLGNFMDVSESKQVEEALRDSEEKYRSLFEMAREGIVILDYRDGDILDANAEFQRQTGCDAEALKTKKIWDVQPPESREKARQAYPSFRETPGGVIPWKIFQEKSGNTLPVEIVAQRMTIDGREVVLCMIRDNSEREAMMRALKRASEEWQKSFDAIEDAVMLITPDFRIQRANLATGRMLGMDVHEIAGKKCYEVFHGLDAPPEYCPNIKTHQQNRNFEVECEAPRMRGLFRFSTSPVRDENGKLILSVGIISDVTQRRKNEQESLRLSQALASSFKGITEALSDLAESRDPYTAGHSRHVAELAVLAGRDMGMDEESLQGLRVSAILHDIGKAIIPAAILNRPGRLSEHEWGLIKAHPNTSYETLRHIPFPWPIAEVVRQHHERLDGSGYPKGLKGDEIHPWAKIIAVADLVDAMTSHRPYRPGLSRQHALDEVMRGAGTLYDPKVTDSLIRVMLLKDRRVLVVDDEPYVMESLVEELNAEGLKAVGFTEPSLALNAFAQKPFPVIITALQMPEMDGIELAKRIKEINPNSEIIVITRHGGKEETLTALRAGASDFLEKPIDLEILRKSVNRALQRYMSRISN